MAISVTNHAQRVDLPDCFPGGRWLDPPRRAHLIGIGGAGMKALAELLLDAGWTLSGSDETSQPDSLTARGTVLQLGHRAENLPSNADVVIYSSAVPLSNAEREAALSRGIPSFSYAAVLGKLTHERKAVCIAGTHGKSTTTALTAHLLDVAGQSPGRIVGAETIGRNSNGCLGNGSTLVVESCEFQRNFLELQPASAAILGIEPDHFDCFPEFSHALASYREFALSIPASGSLVVPAGQGHITGVIEGGRCRIVTFGVDYPAAWEARDVEVSASGTSFDLTYHRDSIGRVRLQLVGRHNVANALAAAALAAEQGVSIPRLIDGLQSFAGIKRRFQRIASSPEFDLIDDYAHHPTAVAATLTAARQVFPGRRLVCIFQPHQISRTERLFDEFAASLTLADRVWIPPIFTARESNRDLAVQWAARLAAETVSRGGSASATASLDRIVSSVEDEARHGDVLITMGAGDIDRTHHEFLGRLFRNSHPG